jgi:hypothetical protein
MEQKKKRKSFRRMENPILICRNELYRLEHHTTAHRIKQLSGEVVPMRT